MLREYIQTALSKAQFKTIEDPEPVFGEIPCCPGVWATGKTMEECSHSLEEVLEEWILLSVRLGNPIPTVDGIGIQVPEATALRE